MTQMELIDRLCAVNTLLTDIVREQAEIMAQHGIEEIRSDEASEESIQGLFSKIERATQENDVIEAQLRRFI